MKSESMSEPDRQRRKIQYSVAPRQGPEGSCALYRTRVAGDPAVAFHIPLQATSRKPPVDGQRRIGINCGRSRGMIWGAEGQLEQQLAVIARELRRLGHNIEFLAVCPEDMEPCRRVAHQAGFADSSVAPVLSSPARFMAKARSLDLLIAFKLHAAVLAAAANLPFVSLEYRPKCLDFAASIGWQRYSLRTSEVEVDQVSDMVATMLADLPALRAQLCDSMCRLAAQFERYCATIAPLLMPAGKGTSF